MDDYLPLILGIVLSINAILFMGTLSIDNIASEIGAPEGNFYNPQGSLICKTDSNNCSSSDYIMDDTDPLSQIPQGEPIESSESNAIVDMFSSIKNWLSDTNFLGLGYLVQILSAPSTFLDMLGLPSSLVFILSGLWYLFTLFILLAFMWGR